MSEENLNRAQHPAESFEHEDLSPLGVFYFLAGLAIVGITIYFILVGMYRYLDAYDRNHQPPMNPMAVTTGVNPNVMTQRQIRQQIDKTFPKPVLEYSERTQFIQELAKEDNTLESYDWVDQSSGIVRIPIEQAIDLMAQRGLPVIPESARAANAAKQPGTAKSGAAGSTTKTGTNTNSGEGATNKGATNKGVTGKGVTAPPK
jgi:hypothetical protein